MSCARLCERALQNYRKARAETRVSLLPLDIIRVRFRGQWWAALAETYVLLEISRAGVEQQPASVVIHPAQLVRIRQLKDCLSELATSNPASLKVRYEL
jgi:hypothetical protein